MKTRAAELVDGFKIKVAIAGSPIASLSGGNVQRAVLARELTGEVELLIISNPCFGLGFFGRGRDQGADRGGAQCGHRRSADERGSGRGAGTGGPGVVMSEGRIAYETPIATADVAEIGHHMAGHA
jgi:general nucleoside transport system ATP-binding protein